VSDTAALRDLLGLPGLLAATVGTALFLGIGLASAQRVRRRLSYERWHALHLGTYLAAGLAFIHQLAGPDLAGRPAVQVAWGLLYAYAYGLVLRYRLVAPLQQALRHRLRVLRVIPEGDGVVSIVIGGRHLDELGAEAGQFFRWRFLSGGIWRSAHPFSLSAPPGGDTLRITVKALGEGSRRLQALRRGTFVLAEGPYGALTARRRTQRSVLLVAGGIGITPMRALFETLPGPGAHLTLLYRASSERDVIFRAELDAIARRRGARVIYLVGPSSDPANALTPAALQRLVPGLSHHDVYLCASPGLAGAMRAALHGAGLPRRRLHEEVFVF
jgi:ferredoxin-NADP reductase